MHISNTHKTASTPRQIARNTLYLTASYILVRLLSLMTTMALTRYLGPAKYGDLMLAYAYCDLFNSLVEAGLSLTIIRQASQNMNRLGLFIGNGVLLRGVLAIGGYILAIGMLPSLGYEAAAVRLFRIAALWLLFSPLEVFRAIFLITLEIKKVAVLDTIGPLVNTMLVLGIISLEAGQVEQVLLIQLVTIALGRALYFVYGRRLLTHPISLQVDWQIWKSLIQQAWPVIIAGAFQAFQIHAGRLIVGRVLSNIDVGLYTIAINLIAWVNFLPALYFSSVYPLLSRDYVANPEQFRWLYRFSFSLMMTIILPLTLMASLTAREIVHLYAGTAYLPASSLFSVLVWGQIFWFAGSVLYYIILATNQQRILPLVSLIQTLVYVGILAISLPRLGLMGMALTTLSTYGLGFVVYVTLKTTRLYMLDWLRSMLRPGIALLILVVFAVVVRSPKIVVWLGGLALYGLALLQMRGIDFGDVRFVREALRQSKLK